MFDVVKVWKEIEKRLKLMTDEEKLQTLIDAEILNPDGTVSDHSMNVIFDKEIK